MLQYALVFGTSTSQVLVGSAVNYLVGVHCFHLLPGDLDGIVGAKVCCEARICSPSVLWLLSPGSRLYGLSGLGSKVSVPLSVGAQF